jgi:hypothetical protein
VGVVGFDVKLELDAEPPEKMPDDALIGDIAGG